VVRENYRAITPPLQDLTSYGFNIWLECSDYDTYKLVREGEPVGQSTFLHFWLNIMILTIIIIIIIFIEQWIRQPLNLTHSNFAKS